MKKKEKCFRIIEHKEYNNTYYTIQHTVKYWLLPFVVWETICGKSHISGMRILWLDTYKEAKETVERYIEQQQKKKEAKEFKKTSIIVYKECTDK